MLAKKHTTAITRAKTEAEKVTAAATAMIETPMDLIRHILQRHEESVIEVMRELSVENEALRKDADFFQDQAHRLRGERAILRDSAKDVIAWCDNNPPAGDALYCIDRLRHAIAATETHNAKVTGSPALSASPGGLPG